MRRVIINIIQTIIAIVMITTGIIINRTFKSNAEIHLLISGILGLFAGITCYILEKHKNG